MDRRAGKVYPESKPSDEDESHKYMYGHLDEDSVVNNGLNPGDEVETGDYLGRISEDREEWGNSSGPHVHLERRERNDETGGWGGTVDPGEESPLIENDTITAPYGGYFDGSGPHYGIDFAPWAGGESDEESELLDEEPRLYNEYRELTEEEWELLD